MDTSTTTHSIYNSAQNVKTYDKDFTPAPEANPQLLNDDGTPKVFYHGTNAEFNTFEKGHKRTRGESRKEGLSQVNPQLHKWLATINDKPSSSISIPDSAPKSNSFDKNSSKNGDSGGRSALARGKTADKATVKLKADLVTYI